MLLLSLALASSGAGSSPGYPSPYSPLDLDPGGPGDDAITQWMEEGDLGS